MTTRIAAPLALTVVLAACSGNPFLAPTDPGGDDGSVAELPGTAAPSASTAITRYEATAAQGGANPGDGFAQAFTYDAAANTYTVDNLAFDGANNYRQRPAAPVRTLGSYGVYEASRTETDPQTGVAIPQFQHRLLAGRSRTGRTEFAIVRTGAYRDYGFGGFVLRRNDAVGMPASQQAAYSGDYAAVRDFSGAGGLEYATGTMDVAIDFEDFNAGDAVQGTVSNRQIFDVNGVNITGQVLAAMNAKYDERNVAADMTELPVLLFKVGPGVIDANGEINGLLDSTVVNYNGTRPTPEVYEDGKYYAIVSGTNADEVVGIVVVEAEDPRADGVTVRETGGFILYRP